VQRKRQFFHWDGLPAVGGTFYPRPVGITINRVYTRAGDNGVTRLAGGQEVSKDDARLEAYGTVDELNAVVGLVIELGEFEGELDLPAKLRRIQHELFDAGGELATLPEDLHPQQILVSAADIETLEKEMDAYNLELPTLKSFILPGGGKTSALIHQARTVCRRAERRVVALSRLQEQRTELIQYLNRLSDWFFVVGRFAAVKGQFGEILWKPGQRDGK